MNFLFSTKSDKNKRRILPSEGEGASHNPNEGRPVSSSSPGTQEKPVDEEGTGFDHRQVRRYTSRSEGHKVIVPHTTEVQYWQNRQQTLPQYTVPAATGEYFTQPKLPLIIKSFKSYGGVVVNELKHVLLREPTNHFDGYVWTLPKGGIDGDETPVQAALREVLEETGYECEVVSQQPIGEFSNHMGSKSTYYLMRPIRMVQKPDDETHAIRWVSFEQADQLLNLSHNRLGSFRDRSVLRYAKEALKIS